MGIGCLPHPFPSGEAEPYNHEEKIPDWVSISSDESEVTDPEPAGLDKRINQLRRIILAMNSRSIKLQWRLDHLCRVRSRLRERQRVYDGTAEMKRPSRAKRLRDSVSSAPSPTAIEPQVLRPRPEAAGMGDQSRYALPEGYGSAPSTGTASGIAGGMSTEAWLSPGPSVSEAITAMGTAGGLQRSVSMSRFVDAQQRASFGIGEVVSERESRQQVSAQTDGQPSGIVPQTPPMEQVLSEWESRQQVSAQTDGEPSGIAPQTPPLEQVLSEWESRQRVSGQTVGEPAVIVPLEAAASVVSDVGAQEPESEEVSIQEPRASVAISSSINRVEVSQSEPEAGNVPEALAAAAAVIPATVLPEVLPGMTEEVSQPEPEAGNVPEALAAAAAVIPATVLPEVLPEMTSVEVSQADPEAGIVAEAPAEAAAVIPDMVSPEVLPDMTNVERIVGRRLGPLFIPQSIGEQNQICGGYRVSVEEYEMVLRALIPSGDQVMSYPNFLQYQTDSTWSAVIFKGFPYGIGEEEYMRSIYTWNGILDSNERLRTVVAVKAQYPIEEERTFFNGMVYVTYATKRLAKLAIEFWNGMGISGVRNRTIVVEWSFRSIQPYQDAAVAGNARYDHQVWNFRAALDERIHARCAVIPYPMSLELGSHRHRY